ncbi:ThiF family adenylyltransferase [Chryseobacterium takakiae]|uniref:ThiF family adenylyltransferase n=1 Tax=Chryseobacterium takakiae TaxID=1302685 RepID=UPI002936DC12|nr:ThiF family adenylyltransferase [Chryseobacterium takakiae]
MNAENFVRNLNHHITFIRIEQKIKESNTEEIISGFDIIVDGSDNFKTRYLINDVCKA